MNDFVRIVNNAISDLKTSKEYEPGKEVSILVPLKGKTGTLRGVPLDDAKITYIEGPRVMKDADGEIIERLGRGDIVCKVTGKIR